MKYRPSFSVALGATLSALALIAANCTDSGGGANGGSGGAASGGASGGATAGSGGKAGSAGGSAGGTAGATGGNAGAVAGAGGQAGLAGAGGAAAGVGGKAGAAGTAMSTPDAGTDAPPAASCAQLPKLKLTQVATANAPALVTQPEGANQPLFVLERSGAVRIIRNNAVVDPPFANLTASATPADGERGLLGLAFHPDYATNGRFFVYYTRRNNDPNSTGSAGDIVIAEGKRSTANPDRADPGTKALVVIPHSSQPNHNGGTLAFGRDGFLYAGTGDGGGGGDPDKNGQKLTTKLAKILRINVDDLAARPPGNFPAPADVHVWAIGMRNPWRWSFDRATGDMYIGDVGQDAWEEVDVIPAGTTGANLGWSTMEATHCFGGNNCDMGGKILPLTEYVNPPGGQEGRAVIGGYVYRGKAIPCLVGRYFYGDNNTNQIWTFVYAGGKATAPVELSTDLSNLQTRIGGLTSFGQDTSGEIYLTDSDGHVYRIDAE